MIMNPTSRTSFGEFAPGTASTRMNNAHGYPAFGKSIPETTSSSAWKGGIWGSVSAIGTGAKSSSLDTGRSQAVTPNSPDYVKGSGSLLPSSSELDPWTRTKGTTTWPLSELSSEMSLGLDSTSHMSNLPHRKGPSSSPFLSIAQPTAIRDAPSSKSRSQSFLDPPLSNNTLTNGYDQRIMDHISRHHSDEAIRRPANSLGFGNNEVAMSSNVGRSASNGVAYSGYNSGAASRSGSVPRTRNGFSNQGLQFNVDYPTEFGENGQFHGTDLYPARPSHSSRPSAYSTNGFRKYSEQVSPMHPPDFTTAFGKLDIGKENHLNHEAPYSPNQQHPNPHQWSHNSTGGIPNGITSRSNQFSYDQTSRHTSYPTRQPKIQFGELPSYSPNAGDYQRSQNSHNSPFFSTNGTPPLQKNGRSQSNSSQRSVPHLDNSATLLHVKLQNLAQEQNPPSTHMNNQYFNPHHINHQQQGFAPLRNQYNTYDYANQGAPRLPHQHLQQLYELQMEGYQMGRNMAHDQPGEIVETLRSTLLEDFRGSHKNQRRWELKDLYNHFVEFSGDQHGSRFIQQKLETANSDDKEQIFQEILPNSLQLMTDVFGNYVTQKLFEHGSQAQKKVLAAQMKGHVYDLSQQMYGCRVVQKAFEHILRDQQATLVKELESYVLKCVKDQNGNHVIQKAIERIPAEHIPFILNAFTGQVHALSTHPYGCRVIQRMLEHCKQPSRGRLLDELHLCASNLITDQYGNYVTQHMIEYGGDEDKARVIDIINDSLIVLSKHKFASNVVEKSIGLGNEEQRQRIANILSSTDDKGESPLQLVMRDAYGNYVVQKLLAKLEGPFAIEFAQKARVQIQLAKRFSYGKQLGVIEKIICELLERNRLELKTSESSSPTRLDTSAIPPTNTPPLLSEDAQSPQTSSLPSTRSSTIEGPIGMQKTIGPSTIEVETSTTPIPRGLRDDIVA